MEDNYLEFSPLKVPCSGCEKTKDDVQLRYDHYGIPTRHYCEDCYENNYPYRKDAYYDYLNAGEYLDDDY